MNTMLLLFSGLVIVIINYDSPRAICDEDPRTTTRHVELALYLLIFINHITTAIKSIQSMHRSLP